MIKIIVIMLVGTRNSVMVGVTEVWGKNQKFFCEWSKKWLALDSIHLRMQTEKGE